MFLAFRDDYMILIQVNVRRKKGWVGGTQGMFRVIEIILYDTVMMNAYHHVHIRAIKHKGWTLVHIMDFTYCINIGPSIITNALH